MRGHVRRGHMGNSLRSSRISNQNGLSFSAQSIAIVHFFNSDHLELMAGRCVAVILVVFFCTSIQTSRRIWNAEDHRRWADRRWLMVFERKSGTEEPKTTEYTLSAIL